MKKFKVKAGVVVFFKFRHGEVSTIGWKADNNTTMAGLWKHPGHPILDRELGTFLSLKSDNDCISFMYTIAKMHGLRGIVDRIPIMGDRPKDEDRTIALRFLE